MRQFQSSLGKKPSSAGENPFMPHQPDIRAASVSITETSLLVEFQDGRALTVPLGWFPALANADPEQLADHRLIGDGLAIHWETIGVDLSVLGLLFDSPPSSVRKEHSRVSYHVVPAGGNGWRLKRQGERTLPHLRPKKRPSKLASGRLVPTPPANLSSTLRTAVSKKRELTALIRPKHRDRGFTTKPILKRLITVTVSHDVSR